MSGARTVRGKTDASGQMLPGTWLRAMLRIRPAPWPWGQAIRAGLSLGIPFGIGVVTDHLMIFMWVAMGALMATAGERGGPYVTIYRQTAISSVIGASGFFAGYLLALPWGGVVLAMGLIAGIAGILSGYGAVLSIGTMQALLIASIAIGVPQITNYWEPALLYLLGALLFAGLLGIEALIFRDRPIRRMVVDALSTLASLAAARAEDLGGSDSEARDQVARARLAAVNATKALFAAALELRKQSVGRATDLDRLAALLERLDAGFVAIMAARDRETLLRLATDLRDKADRVNGGASFLSRDFAGSIVVPGKGAGSKSAVASGETGQKGRKLSIRELIDQLAPGGRRLQQAAALALCMAIAYATHWVNTENHWFWIPLTISLVMKPDLGSVFARAVLRCIGTVAGAALGAVILTLLPKSPWLIVAIALLASALPWAMRRSYVLQCLVLTPMVLLLVDVIVPVHYNVDYAMQRSIDTAIGAVIVLIFGYLIWPRTHSDEFSDHFRRALAAIAGYVEGELALGQGRDTLAGVSARRREAYGELSTLRTKVQMFLAEPPPASNEAAAWFPMIASAERLVDAVTAGAPVLKGALSDDERTVLKHLAGLIRHPEQWDGAIPGRDRAALGSELQPIVDSVASEMTYLTRLAQAEMMTPSAQTQAATGVK